METKLLSLTYYSNKYTPNKALEKVAEKGRTDLVEFFIEKGANDWNKGMEVAARGGHKELVDFFKKKRRFEL